MWLKKRLNLKYIFEVGDLCPMRLCKWDMLKINLFINALYWLEKMIYKESDSIVALSPSIKTVIEKKVERKKIHVLTI